MIAFRPRLPSIFECFDQKSALLLAGLPGGISLGGQQLAFLFTGLPSGLAFGPSRLPILRLLGSLPPTSLLIVAWTLTEATEAPQERLVWTGRGEVARLVAPGALHGEVDARERRVFDK